MTPKLQHFTKVHLFCELLTKVAGEKTVEQLDSEHSLTVSLEHGLLWCPSLTPLRSCCVFPKVPRSSVKCIISKSFQDVCQRTEWCLIRAPSHLLVGWRPITITSRTAAARDTCSSMLIMQMRRDLKRLFVRPSWEERHGVGCGGSGSLGQNEQESRKDKRLQRHRALTMTCVSLSAPVSQRCWITSRPFLSSRSVLRF